MNREEEILLSKEVKYFDWLRMKGTTPSVYDAILEAMRELARERAIGLMNWAAKNRYVFIDYGTGFWCDESENEWMGEMSRLLTTDQLYSKYEEDLKK